VREPGKGFEVLRGRCVEIAPQPFEVDRRCRGEDRQNGLGTHEPVGPQRRELPHWDTVAGDDIGRAFVEPAHDRATVVAQLTLGDLRHHE
jgi:hypothetical protein